MTNEEIISRFFSRIFRVKRLIALHSIIAKSSKNILHQDFFGFLQSDIFIRQVYNEIFIILNDSDRRGLKIDQIINMTANGLEKEQYLAILQSCRNDIISEARKKVRDKEISHFDDFDIVAFQYIEPDVKLDYQKVFDVLTRIEDLLTRLSSDDCPSIKPTIDSVIDYDYAAQDLKDILKTICLQESVA